MRVYGIDFTSSPSALTSKAQNAKWMYLATCRIEDNVLIVESVDKLNSSKANDYSNITKLLTSDGSWVVGIDVPFGMPVECIEYCNWLLPDDGEHNWALYVQRVRQIEDRKAFKRKIEEWRHPTKVNSSGDRERVRKYRVIDRRINSQSPMNCVRPAIGAMFYEACELLLATAASIPPVRYIQNANRHVLEAYPRLVANRLVGGTPYKEADDLEDVRRRMVHGLSNSDAESAMRQWYGITVELPSAIEYDCIEDWDGDKIDSILCAVQAAWSSRQNGFGVPRFNAAVMNEIVALEGWVPDPFLAKWMSTP